jgi:hypothetical protein
MSDNDYDYNTDDYSLPLDSNTFDDYYDDIDELFIESRNSDYLRIPPKIQNFTPEPPKKIQYGFSEPEIDRTLVTSWLAKRMGISTDAVSIAMTRAKDILEKQYGIDIKDKKINAAAFFTWARTKNTWEKKLAQIEKLPHLPLGLNMNVEISLSSSDSDFHCPPSDYKSLVSIYFKLRADYKNISLENQRLNEENSILKSKLQKISDAENEIKQKQSEGGKKGAIARWGSDKPTKNYSSPI